MLLSLVEIFPSSTLTVVKLCAGEGAVRGFPPIEHELEDPMELCTWQKYDQEAETRSPIKFTIIFLCLALFHEF